MNRYLLLSSLALIGSAHSAILIQDNFDNASTADINTRPPSTNTLNSSNWVARTTTGSLFGNGSGGISMNIAQNQTAAIALPSGYLAANPGIYQLSLTITHPSDVPTSWVGFGFTGGVNVSENFTHAENAAGPWLFYRGSGAVSVRPAATGGTVLSNTLAAQTSHTFVLELNTTGAQWSYDLYIDGVIQDANGAGTAGNTFTYGAGANPNINNIAIGTGFASGTGTATIDNFTFALVPEPSHALMLVASAGLLAVRRKR